MVKINDKTDTNTLSSIFNTDVEATNFVQKVLQNGSETLKYYTDKSVYEDDMTRTPDFFNTSIKKLFENLSACIIDLLNDLVKGRVSSFSDLVKGDRLTYLGMLTVIIALFIYLIDVTS